ncbi:MAG: FeS assembly SUF system protein [Ignavibacteriae bacterium HGW-Ignavibacteriae-4]|jgi:FeS assembly SUF system protein|nr:MAG: FeS assembly SUF system protein [Ignavibacteriae bacterium HGW-Ignavibacteriae-4]
METVTKDVLEELEEKAYEKLKEVFDPEIPVNIVELGLIYDITVAENREVVVIMTLTAPNCPVADSIPRDVEMKIMELEEVVDVKAILTFDPPWDMSMMSDEAKLELGFL